MAKLFRVATMLAASAGFTLLSAPAIWAQNVERMEIGARYSFIDTNAPPGGCGCFSLNGGAAWFAYNFSPGVALVGEGSGAYASHIDSTSNDLTLSSFLAGPRYSRHIGNHMVPFGQILLGGAHASGALTPGASGLAGSSNAFAMAAGGGMDLEVSRHWVVRLVQWDYYLTRFNNEGNNHQNNSRVGVGVAYRFGGRGK